MSQVLRGFLQKLSDVGGDRLFQADEGFLQRRVRGQFPESGRRWADAG
jgi:hypothetical protein